MRGESRLLLLALGIGLAPSLIKKSKPFARYIGDHLIKAGEYIKHGMEETPDVNFEEIEIVVPVEAEIVVILEPEEISLEEVSLSEPGEPETHEGFKSGL